MEFEDDELINIDAFEAADAEPLEHLNPKPIEPNGSVSWEQRTVFKRAWLTEDEFKAKYTQRVAPAGAAKRATTKLAKLRKKHEQQVVQRTTHTKLLSSEKYHELWMENVRVREAHKFTEQRVWLKDGVEAPTSPATAARHRTTRPNTQRHIPNPVSKALQQCICMECSLCRTNQYMVEDGESGLICSNCHFELQCIHCHTLCDTNEPNMEVVQEPPGIGKYYWRCKRCDVLIENYYPRLRCMYCKSDPSPTNISSNNNGVWQCLVCTESESPKCKNCNGGVLSTHVEHGNEFKVCKQCGYRCDEVQLPDYMYSLTVGELKPNYDFKPGAKGTVVSGDIQKTDGKWVMNAKHYKQIRDICEAALRHLCVPTPRHASIIRRVIDMVTIEMKDRNYRIDKHTVASLYAVLRNGETPVSRKQFDAILPLLHIPLRGEKPEEASDHTIDKSSAMKSELTRSLNKIKAVSQALAPPRNPWQSTEELVERFMQQDPVLQRHFEGLPKADWGVMLTRARYQVRYMHFIHTTQRPDAVVGKMLSNGYEHEVAGVCFYMTQLPLLMDRGQKVKGRTVKCKEQLRQQLQLRREPYYRELIPMVEEENKVWQLPANLGLSRYTQLCTLLQSYDYEHDYKGVARGIIQSMG